MDFTSLNRKDKYEYLLGVLYKIENSSLFKDEVISENDNLIKQRESDIRNLNRIINDELKNDGIKKIIINGKTLTHDSSMGSFEQNNYELI